MSQRKFLAMYSKNDDLSGYALLNDGTLVKVVPGGNNQVELFAVEVIDKRPNTATTQDVNPPTPGFTVGTLNRG